MITLHFPFPPSLNHYWRHNRGRTHISAEGREYRNAVAWICKEDGIKCITNKLKVSIYVQRPDKRRRDLDNLIKVVLDAMQHGGVYVDDSQIEDLSIRWGPEIPGDSMMTVYIAEIRKQAGGGTCGL
jgi:crossover junction endodeoxyribonuclease RusA